MKCSLKNEYRNIFEFRDLNPINAQPSDFPDLIIINTTLKKILSEQISFNLKIHENKSKDIIVSKKNIVNAYFSFYTHVSQNEEELKKTIAINESKRRSRIDTFKDTKNPPADKQALRQFIGDRYTVTPERGGGADLLTSIVNASNPTEFINAITVFLYRKLVEKSKLEINPEQDEISELEIVSAVNEVINAFKSALQAEQAGLSTTFGPYFELLVYNSIRAKMISDRPESDLSSVPPEIDSSDISLPSKKVSIILINTLLKQQTNYMYNILINKTKTSDSWWKSLFLYSLNLIDTDIIDSSVSSLIDEYLLILEIPKSEYECFEYEKDEELYEAAAEQNLYLPSNYAPFDFIIRQKTNNKEIKFGLFDLKCTNKYTTSNPIATAKTGSNEKNSAIQNISNTVAAFKSLAPNTELRFLGLSSIEYSLDMSDEGRFYLKLEKAKNKISSPQASCNLSKGQPAFILSDDGKRKTRQLHTPGITSIESKDYIVDEIKVEYGAIKDDIKDFSFLCAKLGRAEYRGNFETDINLQNYNNFLNAVFFHAESYLKIKNDLDLCIAQINDSDVISEDKVSIIDTISKIHSDDRYDLIKIITDCIYATASIQENYISKIVKSTPQKLQSRVKKNIAQSVLSILGKRNKGGNLAELQKITGIPLLINQSTRKQKNSNDFYFSNTYNKTQLSQFIKAFEDKISKMLYKPNYSISDSEAESEQFRNLSSLMNLDRSIGKSISGIQDHKRYTGKSLKEVYSHLFKKKIISEGGLAGHMMHPYEALDMTPRQIIDRIKEYSTSQKIIEKVDGQNLFFTVEQDGTLMFARNKEDMTHDDLVTKFTGHPAELPFVEGGNAIKRGVEQWLSSAGQAAEMEIREIFHPDGETRSFINFEIMHPDKPNQIIYDEKYIVFHSIVDYIDGRKTVYSTNKGQRLEKLIRLMDSGISSSGFTLASNRTVNLNQLTNVQIEDYVERVKEVALSLGITEDITLGEGIENIIKKEIDSLGIDLDRETLKKIYDFVLYGEDRLGNKIKSKDFTSSLVKSDVAGLRSLDLTSASKALKKVQSIISPFKDVFVDLGIDLLRGVKSAYMSDETNQKNIELLRDKLQTAIDDLIDYMNEKPENYWEPEVHRLRQHLDKVIDKDITDIVATTIEGGVYDYQGDLIKVTGGFAPLNQILGAAYRDKKGIFPTFKQKFMQQESNRRSLKSIFNLIF